MSRDFRARMAFLALKVRRVRTVLPAGMELRDRMVHAVRRGNLASAALRGIKVFKVKEVIREPMVVTVRISAAL